MCCNLLLSPKKRCSFYSGTPVWFGTQEVTGNPVTLQHNKKRQGKTLSFLLVEATGLEPTTSWSRTKRATKLRYASTVKIL